MSSPTIAPSPALALSRGSAIEYKAFVRRFLPDSPAGVLILMASCSYGSGGYAIFFQPASTGYQLLEKPPTGMVFEHVTYYCASLTNGIEELTPPSHVTITDAAGEHRVHVKPW